MSTFSKITRRIWLALALALLSTVVVGSTSHATDLDIFNPGVSVDPNVMFIFDTSGSMSGQVETAAYDPALTYVCGTCTFDRDAVYKQNRFWFFWLNSYTKVCDDINANPLVCNPTSDTPTATGKTQILTTGFWFRDSFTREYLGNYRNFKVAGSSQLRRKIDIAKDVLNELIDTITGVRMGMMTFNDNEGGQVDFPVSTLDPSAIASFHNAINSATAGGWTPLAETLYEAGLYYSGAASYYNAGSYTSPIQAACQQNYTIIMTDGSSTQDRNVPGVIGDQDGDGREPGGSNEISYGNSGSDYLDDVAKYWLDTDMVDDATLAGVQSMKTYTIGFSTSTDPLANPLLQDTAVNGDGVFFTADNTSELKEALRATLVEIAEDANSFIAPVVPIDDSNRTTSGDDLYLSLFAPSGDALWRGNLKKFALNDDGNLVDANGVLATDSNGDLKDTAVSFWSVNGAPDGGDVRKGGVEEVLLTRLSPRDIYAQVGASKDLNDSSNRFVVSNSDITMAMLGVPDATDRAKLIDFVRGIDTYDDDIDGDTTEKRANQLGDLLHSRPVIIHYDASTSVIFVGSNDGMLHAFNDSDGSERWAYIPADVIGSLRDLRGNTHPIFLDGPVRSLIIDANADQQIKASDGDKALILFGRRRGGSVYTVLDVTNPDDPQLLYEISPSTTGFSELGQSWSKVAIAKVKVGTTDTHVAIISGGYDTNEDNVPVTLADTSGRAVFAFNVLTGAKVWDFSYDATDPVKSTMTYAIPSDISSLDIDGDGYADRLYVGDAGGQLWRFGGTNNSPVIAGWTGKIIFKAREDASDTAQRKFFYPPDVVLEETFEVVLIGTGDRENPLSVAPVERFYSIRDDDPSSAYDERDLVDVTDDLLQSGTSAQKLAVANALASSNGYLIRLVPNPTDTTGLGEKVLSAPITFKGITLFTTFTPNNSLVACSTGGVPRLYAVHYLNGVAVINFFTGNDTGGDPILARQDRYADVGSSLASSPVIALRKGKSVAYIGTGGGIAKQDLPSPPSNLLLLQWNQIN